MTDRILLAQVSVDIRNLEKRMQKSGILVDNASRRMERSWNSATQKMSRDTEAFGRDVRRILTGIGITAAVGEIGQLADAWTQASNELKAAAEVSGTSAASLSSLADVARETRTEFGATATLYARLTRSTADLGVSQAQVIETTRLINQAFKAGGASIEEQRSAILQLSQALQSGVLQGEELRSLRESSPVLIAAIAKEFGVASGALKELGAQGKLTADRVFASIIKAAPEIERQFGATQSTIGDAFTNLRTSVTEYVGTVDSAFGSSASLAGAINSLSDNFDAFANAALIAATLLGARGIGGALNSATVASAQFAAGFRSRHSEMISSLKAEKKAADAAASAAYTRYKAEKEELKNLSKERDKLRKTVGSGPKLAKQYAAQAEAARATAQAEENLRNVMATKGATIEDVAAAEEKVTEARKRQEKIKSYKNVQRLNEVEAKHVAQSSAVVAAEKRVTVARSAAAVATQNLTRATNLLARAGRGLLAFFGGPLGLAITAAGAAMAYFNHQTIKAKQAAEAMNGALSILANQTIDETDAKNLSAEASAKLKRRLDAQREATAALAEVQRRQTELNYMDGLKSAQEEVERLTKKVENLSDQSNLLSLEAFNVGPTRTTALSEANRDLREANETLQILKAGLEGLRSVDFDVKPEALEVDSGSGSSAERSALDELQRAHQAATEAEISRINREYSERLAAIDALKLQEADAAAQKKLAQEIYFRETAKLDAEADASARKHHLDELQRIQSEADLLAQTYAARDAMYGRFITLSSQEYAARRADIEANIADEARRTAALSALADEEAEFRKRTREEALRLDDRSDPSAQISDLQEAEEAKLQYLRDALENEIVTRQEYEDLKIEMARDTEAEILAIRTASAQMQLSAAETMFGGLAELAGAFFTKSSGIYKALFLAEKAAALGSAYVQMNLAIAKANASAPPPFNAPAILAAKVTGIGAIAGIAASTVAGFKSGGYTGDGNPNDEAGVVHKREFVFNAKQTRKLGLGNLKALAAGRAPAASIASAAAPMRSASFSFGDMVLHVQGDGADKLRDEFASKLSSARREIARDVQRSFPSLLKAETDSTTPRHKRPRT